MVTRRPDEQVSIMWTCWLHVLLITVTTGSFLSSVMLFMHLASENGGDWLESGDDNLPNPWLSATFLSASVPFAAFFNNGSDLFLPAQDDAIRAFTRTAPTPLDAGHLAFLSTGDIVTLGTSYAQLTPSSVNSDLANLLALVSDSDHYYYTTTATTTIPSFVLEDPMSTCIGDAVVRESTARQGVPLVYLLPCSWLATHFTNAESSSSFFTKGVLADVDECWAPPSFTGSLDAPCYRFKTYVPSPTLGLFDGPVVVGLVGSVSATRYLGLVAIILSGVALIHVVLSFLVHCYVSTSRIVVHEFVTACHVV